MNRAIANFFGLCNLSGSNCAWNTEPDTATNATLLQKYADWVGSNPTAVNRGRTTATSNIGTRDDLSYFARNVLVDSLGAPWLFPKVARILQYWYDNPGAITNLNSGDVTGYVIPDSAGVKRQAIPDNNGNYNPASTRDVYGAFAIVGITCVDSQYKPGFNSEVPTLSGQVYQNWFARYAETTTYGPEISIRGIYACAPWQTQPRQQFSSTDGRFANIRTRKPILFVQTTYDPVTPEKSGDAAKRAFTNSWIVKSNGAGVSEKL